MSAVPNYLARLSRNRSVVFTLAYDDFRDQYRGSYLGVVWAVVRPALFVAAIWFVFSYGIKNIQVTNEGTPFILHLLCGYLPWLLFSECIVGAMNAIVGKSFLIKQGTFQPSLLPGVKYLSAAILHGVFLVVLSIVLGFHGYAPTIHWLQVPLLILLPVPLVVGVGWLTSSLRVFSNDVTHVVAVVLQVGFWVTPVFWSLQMLSDEVRALVEMNPFVFVVESYRQVFLRGEWISFGSGAFGSYLLWSLILAVVGSVIFRRLRPHFGDVL